MRAAFSARFGFRVSKHNFSLCNAKSEIALVNAAMFSPIQLCQSLFSILVFGKKSSENNNTV